MNKEDIIKMAREAGLPYMYQTGEVANLGLVERFAALIAAAERDKYEAKFKQLEAIMQAREQQPNKPCCLAEREACAKVCDRMEKESDGVECCKWPTPADCATAIRARSNP